MPLAGRNGEKSPGISAFQREGMTLHALLPRVRSSAITFFALGSARGELVGLVGASRFQVGPTSEGTGSGDQSLFVLGLLTRTGLSRQGISVFVRLRRLLVRIEKYNLYRIFPTQYFRPIIENGKSPIW